jgi:hypothetical protein
VELLAALNIVAAWCVAGFEHTAKKKSMVLRYVYTELQNKENEFCGSFSVFARSAFYAYHCSWVPLRPSDSNFGKN